MLKLSAKNLSSKIVLIFLILWGAASFFVFPTIQIFQWAFLIVSVLAVYFVLSQRSSYFILIQAVFSSSYFFYGLQSAYGLPLWSIILGLAVFFTLIFHFLGEQLVFHSQHFNLITNFFLISMLEIFLALSFWLINPLTKSTIIGIFAYLFSGFLSNLSKDNIIGKNFYSYIYTAAILFFILVLTVSWGR